MSDEAAQDPARPAPPPAQAGPPPGPEPTGDPRVDEALARLGGLAGTPVAGHVAVFGEIHQRLQDLLTSADQDDHPASPAAPATPGPGGPRPAPPGLHGPHPGPPGARPESAGPWPGASGGRG
ncbi:hypothetical protein [Spirillospora sp. NPDC029432]|uniref:hypothetical protein n=1 Tax=Spirillospora sp. NPDC029432 TaxID=3154599 RepID=UPI00345312EE